MNYSGLWIFSRSPTRSEALITKVRGIAAAMNFDLTVLNDVVQTEDVCKYEEKKKLDGIFGEGEYDINDPDIHEKAHTHMENVKEEIKRGMVI
jgi:hypothetical protein